ncbi:RHS repeat-associated core domain-containing protein [Elizabethkingia anophelis]|uniref:RHS repeat-associated core domain-containing protein n=1 Tax=Elizabethkingia anophelis TaxID=1117645 RepID=UPI003733D282
MTKNPNIHIPISLSFFDAKNLKDEGVKDLVYSPKVSKSKAISFIESDLKNINTEELIENAPFHNTQGQIDVNSTGQFQFTFPIATPPGVKNVSPQINLVYTSGGGNGIAGYGWGISGISSISRIGKTLEEDGERKGVQLDYSDYYQFNGQRLILLSGEYGKDSAEYTTEKYSNIKIKSVGVNDNRTGPSRFEVTFEDGSQAWYGETASESDNRYNSASTPIEYNIVKWIDAQGNYITYNYITSYNHISGNNVALLYSVLWGGNEIVETSHFNKIVFNYVQREIKEISYLKGVKFVQDSLLASIEVYASDKLFKSYAIEYAKDDKGNKYQFVKSITESNSIGEKANPVIFNYQESKSGGWDGSWILNDQSEDLLYGDFDGDGKLDMLKYVDSFQECQGYSETYHPGNEYSSEDDYNTDYYDQSCLNPIQRPAGIYLFSSIFDDNRPEKVFAGDIITRDQLKKTKACNIKTSKGVVLPRQGLITYKTIGGAGKKKDLEIKAYSIDVDENTDTKQLKEEFTNLIPGDVYDNTIPRDPNVGPWGREYWVDTSVEEMKEMDIDGDGLSELVFVLCDTSYTIESPIGSDGNLQHSELTTNTTYRYLIVRPGETDSKNFLNVVYIPEIDGNFFGGNGSISGDFNGDGIVDFLTYDRIGLPYLTTFKYDTGGGLSVNTSLYSRTIIEGIRGEAVVGDFTGDGKTSLMVPQAMDSESWKLYISTGEGFEVQNLNNFALFKKKEDIFKGQKHNRYIRRQFFARDLNKDGKADLIEFYSHIIQEKNGSRSKFIIIYHENRGTDINGNIIFEKVNIDGSWLTEIRSELFPYKMDWYPEEYSTVRTDVQGYAYSTQNSHYSPVIGDFRINNLNESILIFQLGRLIKYSHYKVSEEARIISVTQGDITTEIEYKELDPNINKGFYKAIGEQKYPYMELDKVSGSYAVSQLRQEGRKQDFKYRGYIVQLQGKGVIGFRQFAKSSWYADGYEDTKIWNGIEIDPLNEGVPVKEWSVRNIDNDDLIFPAVISLNNDQLLSFKSTEYKTDISSIGIEAIVPIKTITKDFLKDIIEETDFIYNEYYLPEQVTTKVNEDFAKTITLMAYCHNPVGIGKDYFIGRLVSRVEEVNAYGDIQSAREEYGYENNLLKTYNRYNRDNSGWIQENYDYDDYGNIIKKIITNSIDIVTQTEASQYDLKGRFPIKKTNNLGLDTHIEYNDWGLVTNQIDPLGNTIYNVYDEWGKLQVSKSSLGGETTYLYGKLWEIGTVVIEYMPDGNVKEVITDKFGQKVRVKANVFGNKSSAIAFEYDILGRKTKEYEPYYDSGFPTKFNKIEYDDSVFPPKVTATSFNGKQIETSISGNITITKEVNGYKRITKSTTDALGNVVSSEDKGGVIDFTFNAAGEQLTANYEGNVVTTKYDKWGRKSEFNDPSNGLYTYEYNGFGQIRKEISPNGYKEFFYNEKGQLESQSEKSNTEGLTDKKINFNYNDKGLLISKAGISNGKEYSTQIIYDAYGRVQESSENSNGCTYTQKDIIYDLISRVISYEKEISSGKESTHTSIENVYDQWSGFLFEVKDKSTGNTLWNLQETAANSQVIRARLGVSDIVNIYDSNNFMSQTEHRSEKGLLFGSRYTFDAVKNELKDRSRQGNFALDEIFTYDDNNRLVQWTNPKTAGVSSNKYDFQGRIIENDQLGKVYFNNRNKVYQSTGIKLNTTGKQNYLNAPIQRIVYNENNNPLFIQSKKGDIRFEYGLTGARQAIIQGQNLSSDNEQLLITKYYSEDGSFEVLKDHTTGEEKHILYIGDNPYESNIVYLKDYAQSSGSYKFLHKDYLGTIQAISDEYGNLVEECHFDAWGLCTKWRKPGSLSDLTEGERLINRGYTSHEHFDDVGIIHMNGRLYDPLLRRFLNADPYIQDPYNTQNYNKYGYVLNNPLLYADPTGEFIWIIIGAIVGAFLTGAAANGSFNPLKWDWKNTWDKIALGAVFGAISGGVGALAGSTASTMVASTLGINGGILGGAIAGLAGGAVGGAISGLGNALIFGESVGRNVVRGAVAGAVGGAIVGGVIGGLQQGIANLKVDATGIGTKNNIITGRPVAPGRSAWALNNTAKVSTSISNKTSSITIGNITLDGVDVGNNVFDPDINAYRPATFNTGGENWQNPQSLSGYQQASFSEVNSNSTGLFTATKEGVILPKGALIPKEFVENPYRNSSYGIFENGKYIEKLRIDPATPPGFKGPMQSHFHLNGGKRHIFDLEKWPWWK